jgi:hypothetical protein
MISIGRINTYRDLNELIEERPDTGCRIADNYLYQKYGRRIPSSCLACPFAECKGREYDLFRKRELCHV